MQNLNHPKISISKLVKINSIWPLIYSWPQYLPLIFLRIYQGRFFILAIKFSEISYKTALNLSLDNFLYNTSFIQNQYHPNLPFYTGIIGILSYDDFCDVYYSNIKSKFFYIYAAIVFDNQTKTCWLCESIDSSSAYVQYQIDINQFLSTIFPTYITNVKYTFHLIPYNTYQYHKKIIEKAITDIKNGQYYQINLLRYFVLEDKLGHEEQLYLLYTSQAPYANLIRTDDFIILSLSPEKFIELSIQNNKYYICTYPIKGTATRYRNFIFDKLSAIRLLKDKKNLAELHMIIDLMRNDIYKITLANTVQVINTNALYSFKNVHHLIGNIKGILQPNLTLKDIFVAVCPGGSITGAPKKEVMNAIYRYENRYRGYFMGNIFCFDLITGRLDSSILIRTIVYLKKAGIFEFAAGGGIVIKSNSEKELSEICHKAAIVGMIKEQI